VSKSGSVSRSQALFVLAWFHAIVQERRIFIPQVNSSFLLLYVCLIYKDICMETFGDCLGKILVTVHMLFLRGAMVS